MSFLRKIFNRFSNKAVISPEVQETPHDQGEPNQPNPVFTYSIYDTGFSNGVLKIQPDEDSFHRYLKQTREVERLEEVKRLREAELNKLENQLEQDRQTVLEKKQSLSRAKQQWSLTDWKLNEVLNKKQEKETKKSVLSKQRDEIKPEYSWLPALFYFLAGIVFILTDVAITKDITSNGFDMDKKEAWIFAIGLACTAFLIKPLIDRMLEKQYQRTGQSLTKLYKIVLLVITVLGLSMLFLLGEFRSEAQTAQVERTRVMTQIKNATTVNDLAARDAHETELGNISQRLGNSIAGKYGILLSGILFAIGGGLCLAIAFPSLSALSNRYYFVPFRISRLQRSIRRLQGQLVKLQTKSFDQKGNIASLEDHLQFLNYDQLLPAIQSTRIEVETLVDAIYAEKGLADQHFYLAAKERGSKYELEGDLKFTVRRNSLSAAGNGNQGDEGFTGRRKYTRRPYVKLRKILADTYNKNKKGEYYEDTDFEIL